MVEFNLLENLSNKKDNTIIIWIFNIGVEKYWYEDNYTIKNSREDAIVNHIEEMNILLTRSQDILILRNKPNDSYLLNMKDAGFSIPHILCPTEKNEKKSISELVINDKKIISQLKKLSNSYEDVYFIPYGISYLEEKIANKCNLKLVGSGSNINKLINNKIFSRELASNLQLNITEGEVCESIKDVKNAYNRLKNHFNKIIIKLPHGASGKGLYIIDTEKKLKSVLLILERFKRTNNCTNIIVEGWYEKKADINYQVYVSKSGKIKTFSVKEQIVKETVYVGSIVPPRISKSIYNQYIQYGEIIGKKLYDMGFDGVIGIDSIITTEDIIVPIIEINARFTLSTYTSFLENKFKNKIIYSFYEKISIETNLNYIKFQKILLNNQLLFSTKNNKGIIVYTSETLNINRGRLFVIIVANNLIELEKYTCLIKNILITIKERI